MGMQRGSTKHCSGLVCDNFFVHLQADADAVCVNTGCVLVRARALALTRVCMCVCVSVCVYLCARLPIYLPVRMHVSVHVCSMYIIQTISNIPHSNPPQLDSITVHIT